MEPITRRCLSCCKDLTLDHYDLTKRTRVCNACAEPWPGAKLAVVKLYNALGKSVPLLARALGYTQGTTESVLYGRARMRTRASHRVRVAYEKMRIADNGVTLIDSAEELAEKAKQRARMERRRAQVQARAQVPAAHDEPPCPKLACGHGEEAHTMSGFCTELDCPCGQSESMDTRARDAIAGGNWEMAQEEMERRGFERHS